MATFASQEVAVLHGLASRPELNSAKVLLDKYDARTCRWCVRVVGQWEDAFLVPESKLKKDVSSISGMYGRSGTPPSRPGTPSYAKPPTPSYAKPPTPSYAKPPTPQYKPPRPSTPQYPKPPTPKKDDAKMEANLVHDIKDAIDKRFKSAHDAFLAMDTDRSGTLTKKQIYDVLVSHLHLKPDLHTVELLFEHADSSHHGKIDYSEFCKALYHSHMQKKPVFGAHDNETGMRGHVVSNAVTSWGGQVYLNENLEGGGHEYGGLQQKHGQYKSDYMLMALPHSVAPASKAELATEIGDLREHINTKFKLMQSAFKQFDEDQSGYLEKEELKKCIQHFNLMIPEEHVGQIIEKLAGSSGGKVDYEHFVKELSERTEQHAGSYGRWQGGM